MADIKQIKIGSTTYGIMPSKLENTNIAYCTCDTAADVAIKVVHVQGNSDWKLQVGSFVSIQFTNTNTASNPQLDVNDWGAKNICREGTQITTSNLGYAGTANRLITYVYDGTQFRFVSWGIDSNTTYSQASLGQGYGTCSTAAATVAKVVKLSSYTLSKGGIVSVKFTNAVPASATMNINSKGAKAIYYRGAAIVADIIKAGDIATFIYDGTQYHLLSIDRWQADLNGKAASSHKHSAADINTSSTLGARVNANATATATLANVTLRNIYAKTTDMTAGSTALTTGAICLIYE